ALPFRCLGLSEIAAAPFRTRSRLSIGAFTAPPASTHRRLTPCLPACRAGEGAGPGRPASAPVRLPPRRPHPRFGAPESATSRDHGAREEEPHVPPCPSRGADAAADRRPHRAGSGAGRTAGVPRRPAGAGGGGGHAAAGGG